LAGVVVVSDAEVALLSTVDWDAGAAVVVATEHRRGLFARGAEEQLSQAGQARVLLFDQLRDVSIRFEHGVQRHAVRRFERVCLDALEQRLELRSIQGDHFR
jgi:hypothetical protein